jgi:ABC-type multidrug transport system fused ATPase/permease subunit
VDIQDLHLETVHQQLSVALQDSVLFSGTIAFNLRYGAATANDDQLAQAAHTAVADEFIDPLPQRFAAPVEQRGKNFSGGQRQRLNLARAFVPNHPIVILDDATSAVDQTTNAQIKTRLAATRRGETTIIISQRVTNVMACDQIIVLDAGRITAQGNHESLQRDSAFYQQLVATQLGGGRYAAE